jgi:Transposase DDE domain
LAEEDIYICPAGERLTYRYSNEENGLVLRRYWINACSTCAIKHQCTTGVQRHITRWEHEHLLEVVQRRLDEHPEKMRQRRETVEHPFGTIKARMGATHFLMKTLHEDTAADVGHLMRHDQMMFCIDGRLHVVADGAIARASTISPPP